MKFFIAIGSFLVLLLSAALIVPLFVDWTAFREDFEREASRLLGQPVAVRGEAEARLLPFPSLTFTDVVVGADEDEPVMTLQRFRMDAELAPYLSGEIRIFQMRLEEPHLLIVSGRDEAYTAPVALGGSGVVLEQVEIAGGRVTLRDAATGRARIFSGIDASLSAQTLNGPFSGTGALTLDRRPFTFSLSSGRIAEGGEWPLRLTLSSQALDTAFVFDGATHLAESAGNFAGRFELHSPLAEREEVSLLPPVRVRSALELSPERASLTELRAEVGVRESPYVLTGEGSLDIAGIPHFELRLQGEQVNVDALPGAEGQSEAGPAFAARLEAVRRTLAAIPPIEIPGEIDLTLPVVTAGDTTIRETHFRGSPTEEGWAIRELSMELPGRTLVEASGLLTVRERMGFAGDLLVAARQPGRFASWLSGAPAEPELAALSRAGFSGRVWLTGEEQRFDDLEVDVGGQTLTGRLERSGEAGARLLAADLAGEAADLDAFLAFARLFNGGSDVIEPVETLDLRLDAGPVALGPYEAEALAVDFSYGADVLDLRSLIVSELSGISFDARGTVEALTGEARPDLAFEVAAADLGEAAGLLMRALPEAPLARSVAQYIAPLGAAQLAGSVATTEDGAGLESRLTGHVGPTQLELAWAAPDGSAFRRGEGRYRLDASLIGEEPGTLLAQLGFFGVDLGLPGPLALSASVEGEGWDGVSGTATLEAPGTGGRAEGTLGFDREGLRSADITLAANSDDASLWLLAAGLGLGQGLDALPLDLSSHLAWTRQEWRLSDLSGEMVETAVTGELVGQARGRVTGQVSLAELSLPWLATLVYAGAPETLSGSLWPEQPFGTTLLPSRPFSVAVDAGRLAIGGGAYAEAFSARLEGEGDRLRIAEGAADFAGGRLEGTLDMRNSGGFGSVVLDMAARDLSAQTQAFAAVFGGEVRAEGSGQSFREIAASLTGEGKAAISGAVLREVAPGRLPAVLSAADEENAAMTSEAIADLVRELDEGASYPLGDMEAPLTVGMGVVRMQPVVLEQGDERLTLGGTVSLADFTVDAGLSIAFAPPEDERIEETAPSLAYRSQADPDSPFALADVEPLTSYLSVRAYVREQERLEAMREDLRETVRLRREARYYRHLAAERARVEEERQAAAEAERLRLEAERLRAGEEAAEAERRRLQAAARAAEAAARAEEEASRAVPQPPSQSSPLTNFEPVFPMEETDPRPSRGYDGLPGVAPPLEF